MQAPVPTPTFAAYLTGIDGCLTAISTLVLAILTVVIAKYAYKAYKTSRASLEASKASLEESKKANLDNMIFNQRQATENTIFKMLEYHSTNYREMHFLFPKQDKRIYGSEAFAAMYVQLRNNYLNSVDNKKTALELIKDAFTSLYLNNSQIGAYYKNLYLLLKYIDNAKQIDSKDVYISILKAQLTRYEILLLPYNCVWIEGDKEVNEEFTTLVGKYDLLTALEQDALIDSKNDLEIFQSKEMLE